MKLRKYQAKAITECLAHLNAGTPTLLVAPTGAGKTVIAAEIAKSFKHVMLIAHRREILQQARDTFGWQVSACSVQGFISKNQKDLRPREVDLLIIDEAHRSVAPSYQQIRKAYPNAKLLGMTATPLRTDGKGLSDAFSVIVQCSNIEELVKGGYLVPYRAFEAPDEALGKLAWVKKLGGDYATKELSALMNKPRLVGDVVREYLKHGRGRKAIAFAVSREHSRALTMAFQKAGVRATHVDGNSSARLRDEALKSLASGKIDVVCNVNLFTEGWDCPPVSCVIMARPTASVTLYLQSVGRGMRPAEGKDDLLILDHAGNIHRHGPPNSEEFKAWRLESDRDKAKREAEEVERARLAALGFDSVEAELQERTKLLSETYTSKEVGEILSRYPDGRGTTSLRLKRLGVKSEFGIKKGARYRKSAIDRVVSDLCPTYTSEQVAERLGIGFSPMGIRQRVRNFLRRHSIESLFPKSNRYPSGPLDELYKRIETLKDKTYSFEDIIELSRDVFPNKSKNAVYGMLNYSDIQSFPSLVGQWVRYDRSQVDSLLQSLRSLKISCYNRKEALKILKYAAGCSLKYHGIKPVAFGLYSKAEVDRAASEREKSATEKNPCRSGGRETHSHPVWPSHLTAVG